MNSAYGIPTTIRTACKAMILVAVLIGAMSAKASDCCYTGGSIFTCTTVADGETCPLGYTGKVAGATCFSSLATGTV
jgi:hypothetical protein